MVGIDPLRPSLLVTPVHVTRIFMPPMPIHSRTVFGAEPRSALTLRDTISASSGCLAV